MPPRSLLPTLIACACEVLASSCGERDSRPNVVIIALDTLRPDHLGCYGHTRDTSPNLDRFASQAVVFENAQTAAPWTAPSLLSLMTSLHPSVHGIASFPEPGAMHERVTTLAEVLEAAGYATAAFTDGGFAKAQFGLGQGFDFYPLNTGDEPHNHASNLEHPSRLRPNIERALPWIDEFADGPFFLFFHSYEVHGPYVPPEADIRHFRPHYDEVAEHAALACAVEAWNQSRTIDAEGLRLILRHQEHCHSAAGLAEGMPTKMAELGVTSLEPERMQFWRDLYDAEIRHTDRELARLLERLERDDVRDDTLVLIVSDHGEAFGEHGLVGHGNALHEEALRIVLMLRAPGIAPRRVRDVVRSIDVMPTLLDLARISRSELALQGQSLEPLLSGRPWTAQPVFSHALSRNLREGRLWSVRDGNWRLIWDEERATAQLYDLDADPQELRDVAREREDVAARLLGLLRAQRDIDATFRQRAAGPPGPYRQTADDMEQLAAIGYVGHGESYEVPEQLGLPVPRLGQ